MKMKSTGGFTLVELIVVIAILAILAAVAVPAYTGYITKAQDAAIVTELDAIQTAAQAANATAGQITKITVSADGTTISVYASTWSKNYDSDFVLYYNEAAAGTDVKSGETVTAQVFTIAAPANWTTSTYKTGATWTSTGWAAGIN